MIRHLTKEEAAIVQGLAYDIELAKGGLDQANANMALVISRMRRDCKAPSDAQIDLSDGKWKTIRHDQKGNPIPLECDIDAE
jgi:hypothetical protein